MLLPQATTPRACTGPSIFRRSTDGLGNSRCMSVKVAPSPPIDIPVKTTILPSLSSRPQLSSKDNRSKKCSNDTMYIKPVASSADGLDAGGFTQKGHAPGKLCNQDRYVCRKRCSDSPNSGSLFGVFDGHGKNGHHVSEWLSTVMPIEIARAEQDMCALRAQAATGTISCLHGSVEEMGAPNREAAITALLQTLRSAHKRLEDGLLRSGLEIQWSGSTSCVVYLSGRHLVVMNVGDSRAVLGVHAPQANGERGALCAKAISIDHKPGNPDERERIMQGGGCVAPSRTLMGRAAGPLRVWDSSRQAGLATSRSFGDMGYRVNGTGGVISEPQMHVFEITSEARFVVIGSDGLWDQLSPAEAVSLASHFSSRGADYAAEELVEAALGRWRRVGRFHDDITAVVVKLPAPRASA